MGKITTKGTGDYNDAIEKLLRKIEGNYDTHKSANPVGSLLLSTIRASSKDLTILPMASYLGQGTKQCRAIEEPKERLKSTPKGIGRTAVINGIQAGKITPIPRKTSAIPWSTRLPRAVAVMF